MEMKVAKLVAVAGVCALGLSGCRMLGLGRDFPDTEQIELQGTYGGHLQDVWQADGTIWWTHTDQILRTDMTGKILQRARVDGHHAGCEVKDGKLYVAVCPMQSKTNGKTTAACHPQINVYDATTLELLETHVLEGVVDRAGSLAILADGSFVIGCLRPQDISPTQVRFHHVTSDFKLIGSHVLDGVPVKLGIEVMKRHGDGLYLCCYYPKGLTIRLDGNFREVARYAADGATGLVFDADAVWVGVTKRNAEAGYYTSKLVRVPAARFGL
ncbi:MAG: hypothetical protein ACI4Q3_09150 [Kiritimatiellia bacterium]